MKTKLYHLTTSSLTVLALTFIPTASFAQDGAGETVEDQIVVTGTRIQRNDLVSQSPLVTTDIERINIAGNPTLDEFLKELPQFGPGQGDFSNDSNGGTAGRATLNLRNLGSQRNLVLMDGRRLISSGTDGAIDINTVPSLAIGGVEVITGGASATYGSDALSGVVNFKTRTDLDGFEVRGQYTALDNAGDDTFKLGAAYGTDYADGRGMLLITGEHTERGGVFTRERDLFFDSPQVSSFIPNGLIRSGVGSVSFNDAPGSDFAAIGGAFNQGNGGPIGADANGAAYGGSTEPPIFINGRGGVQYYGQFENYLQVPLDQTTVYLKTDYDFDNGVTGYGHALFASSTASNIGAPPISASVWGVSIPTDNYFLNQLSPALRDGLIDAGIASDAYQFRVTQVGNRIYETGNDVVQILGGLSGSIDGKDINWDIHASYGETNTEDRTISGAVNFAEIQRIIDTTSAVDGRTTLCNGGFNPFGGTDPLSADCLDFVSRAPVNETKLTQTVIEGTIEGKLTDMPAGEARFALTGQIRNNKFDFNPDPDIAAGELANLASTPRVTGEIEVYEAGAEVFLPLLAENEILDTFNVTLGARLSSYEPGGGAETFKAEFDSRVNDNLLIRGGYNRAVRVPNVDEFFRPQLLRVNPFSNWCAVNRTPPGVDATGLANIETLCGQLGQQQRFGQGGSSGPTFTEGNRDLTPETADTITLGGVLNFKLQSAEISFTADYYDIKIQDPIQRISAAAVFNKCLNTDGRSNPNYDPNYILCEGITFNTSGNDINPVDRPTLNGGQLKTSGFDFTADIGVPVDFLSWRGGDGRISLNATASLLQNYEVEVLQDEGFLTDFTGTVDADQAFPELKMFNSVRIDSGPITVVGTWRHVSGMDFSVNSGQVGVGDEDSVDAFNYFDLSARATISESYEIFAGVNNITDKEPDDIDAERFFNTNRGVYDVIGRSFFVGAKARF